MFSALIGNQQYNTQDEMLAGLFGELASVLEEAKRESASNNDQANLDSFAQMPFPMEDADEKNEGMSDNIDDDVSSHHTSTHSTEHTQDPNIPAWGKELQEVSAKLTGGMMAMTLRSAMQSMVTEAQAERLQEHTKEHCRQIHQLQTQVHNLTFGTIALATTVLGMVAHGQMSDDSWTDASRAMGYLATLGAGYAADKLILGTNSPLNRAYKALFNQPEKEEVQQQARTFTARNSAL